VVDKGRGHSETGGGQQTALDGSITLGRRRRKKGRYAAGYLSKLRTKKGKKLNSHLDGELRETDLRQRVLRGCGQRGGGAEEIETQVK